MYKQSFDSCRFYYVKYGSSSMMSIAEDRVDERVGYVECKEKPLYIVCEE